jgi:hypothetical protein
MNPYKPSETTDVKNTGRTASTRTWGPWIYIVVGGFIAGLAASPYHSHLNPIGLATTPVGMVVGGLIYRARSRNWPLDAGARGRYLVFCVVAIIAIPVLIGVLVSLVFGFDESTGRVMILGGFVGVCLVAGVLASGGRRRPSEDESCDPTEGG